MAALDNTIFPFLSLPGEIRNLIYRNLLLGDQIISPPHYAQILRTCNQVNREATDILYTEEVVRIYVTSSDILVYKLPLFSTDIPLPRIKTLEIHILATLQRWDYETSEARKLRTNVLALCRHWPKHHALKKLTITISWRVAPEFGAQYHFLTFSDPEEETSILSPFSMMRNIQSVTIRSSIPTDFYRTLMDLMHGENELEETV